MIEKFVENKYYTSLIIQFSSSIEETSKYYSFGFDLL